MADLSKIYAVWDTAEAMAADLGKQSVTVRQWRTRGNIPVFHWQDIIDAAARKGVALALDDFERSPELAAFENLICSDRAAA